MTEMKHLAKRLVFAQAMDVATFVAFYVLVANSPHSERNPLINVLFALGGFALVALVKMGLVSFVAFKSSGMVPSKGLIIAISMATASGIAGAGFNLASLIDSTL